MKKRKDSTANHQGESIRWIFKNLPDLICEDLQKKDRITAEEIIEIAETIENYLAGIKILPFLNPLRSLRALR